MYLVYAVCTWHTLNGHLANINIEILRSYMVNEKIDIMATVVEPRLGFIHSLLK